MSLSEWAKNEHVRLSSEGSVQPGQWQCFPYQVEPLDCMGPQSPYSEVVLMMASQMSKTQMALCLLAHIVAEDPGPCLIVEPTLTMAEALSKDRIGPMFRDMPVLQGIVADPKSRDAGSTIFHRRFRGGHVTVVGSNSPAGLASRPIRYLFLDELDRFENSAGAEGDPAALAIAQTRTFWNRKVIWTSSPTVKDSSRIPAALEESDQREFYVPYPLCGAYQVLKWPRVEWPEDSPESAFYRCEKCEGMIDHHRKARMVNRFPPGSRVVPAARQRLPHVLSAADVLPFCATPLVDNARQAFRPAALPQPLVPVRLQPEPLPAAVFHATLRILQQVEQILPVCGRSL